MINRQRLSRWWRRGGMLAIACGAVVAFALVWNSGGDDLFGDALGPVAQFPDTAADDGAGDGAVDGAPPAAEREFLLSLPDALEDERVVAALAPIANLACKRSDYATPAPAEALAADATGDGADRWLDAGAANVALSPLTEFMPPKEPTPAAAQYAMTESAARERSLAAPSAPSEADVDSLLTEHLFGAALSPLAALHAPEADASADHVAVAPAGAGDCPQILQHTFNRLQTGESQSLCQFQGKVLLIVNTASYCGNTPQYEGLEAMYRKYKDRGLVVVGFPSNDFGGQEPGSNKEIAEFCRTTYGVEFPMFEKSTVARTNANPLFVELTAKTGSAPRWNFHKYLVDRTGTRITSFSSDVKPDARDLVDQIERLLQEKGTAKG